MKKSAGPTVKGIVEQFRPLVKELREVEYNAEGIEILIRKLPSDYDETSAEWKALDKCGRANDKKFKALVGTMPESEVSAFDVRAVLDAISRLAKLAGVSMDCQKRPWKGPVWTRDIEDYDFDFNPKRHRLRADGSIVGYREKE